MGEAMITSVYWDERTKKRVREMADHDRRSVSAMICFLIDEEYRRRLRQSHTLVDERATYTVEAPE